jgi:RNA polymerase sigma factor (sigma-70 family)
MDQDQTTEHIVEAKLLTRYKESQDPALVGELYSRYMALVYGVCLKYLKDREESRDAVMHIYETLLEALKKHEVSNFKSWLYTLARNHCLMKLRAEKGRHFEDISMGIMENVSEKHPDSEPDLEQNVSKLEKCLEALVPDQRTCVQLFYYEQKCYREIESITGLDNNRVKSHIQNGKRNLKICMERNG